MPWLLIYLSIGWLIRAAMMPVILRRQMASGASLAWLGIIFLHPYIGASLYALVGESRLGPRRTARHREIVDRIRDPQHRPGTFKHKVDPDHGPYYESMVAQAQKISGLPVLGNNSVDFLDECDGFVDRLVSDINAAKHSVNLLYYIFQPDNEGTKIAKATAAAAKRGVECRILVDAIAGRYFFKRHGLNRELVEAGVKTAAALPVAPFRRGIARMDFRNHRKLAIIDGETAFAGSHNIINCDYGGRKGNPWVDITARIQGPIVGELAMVFAEDWAFETGEDLPVHPLEHAPAANVLMQAVPTGPSSPDATYRKLLLAAIQCSQKELTITTPYFVPDEPTILSLLMAADRGVDVKLIVPEFPDHFFTAAAGRAHFDRLLSNGISIYLFKPGILHAKTTTVDNIFSVFGSANLDVRSFSLNFELSLMLYGEEITKRLRGLQENYLRKATKVEAAEWAKRGKIAMYRDRAITLLSPLL